MLQNTYPVAIRSLWIAVIITVVAIAIWEINARSNGYKAYPDDDKHLWAAQRAKVEDATADDVVLIGSSRVLFNIQLDTWQAETGKKPIQLALPGSSPLPVFKDVVENTDFAGTLIVGVTPGLYFSPPSEEVGPFRRALTRVKHYARRTWAERTGHCLGLPLQWAFAFLRNEDDTFYNDLDLATLVKRLDMRYRVEDHPPFPWLGNADADRNTTLNEQAITDTAYANKIKAVWTYFGESRLKGTPPPPEEIAKLLQSVIDISTGLVKKFESRGGKVIFVRSPAQGRPYEIEQMLAPRAPTWDALLAATGSKGYHFEDHEFMKKYILYEWSHLSGPDAKLFTRDLIRQMKTDGVL